MYINKKEEERQRERDEEGARRPWLHRLALLPDDRYIYTYIYIYIYLYVYIYIYIFIYIDIYR